jgi:hypothetical protein
VGRSPLLLACAAGGVALALTGCGGGSGSSDSINSTHRAANQGGQATPSAPGPTTPGAAMEDVRITSCQYENDQVIAQLHVTNHTTQPALYRVTVSFQTPDGQQITNAIALANVAPGADTTVPATAPAVDAATPRCTVFAVDRQLTN